MPGKCVVSFADGTGSYRKKLQRLEQSLNGNFDGDFLGFKSYSEIECESHSAVPYKFKPAAIRKAINLGYDLVIWLDSPVFAKKPLNDFVSYTEENGYAFFNNIGYSLSDYTNDKTLSYYGIDRQKGWDIPMIMACTMSFNFKNPQTMDFFKQYESVANELYCGEWFNDDLTESKDMRVKGHRHDQSVASCIIHKMGLTVLKGQDTFFAYEEHRKVMPINESVCLFSAG
jgi:hypothetical protein